MNEMSAARWMVSRSDIGLYSDLLSSGCRWLGRQSSKHRRKLAVDVTCDSPTLIDEGRIEIDAGRAGTQHRHDIGGAAYAAIALDGDAPTRESGRTRHVLQCSIEDRTAV